MRLHRVGWCVYHSKFCLGLFLGKMLGNIAQSFYLIRKLISKNKRPFVVKN